VCNFLETVMNFGCVMTTNTNAGLRIKCARIWALLTEPIVKPFATLSNKSDLLKGITFLRVKTISGCLLVSSRTTFSSRCWITVSLNDPHRMIFPWAFVKCQGLETWSPARNLTGYISTRTEGRQKVFYFLEFIRMPFRIHHDSDAVNTMLLLDI
jgi:hypothetical protein